MGRINSALDTTLGVAALFDAPVVSDLAVRIDSDVRTSSGSPALTATARPERIPLSVAQQRMWFVNQFDTSSPAYNIPVALQLDGVVDLAALQAALGDVMERHESLRTVFPGSADGPPAGDRRLHARDPPTSNRSPLPKEPFTTRSPHSSAWDSTSPRTFRSG